MNPIVPMSDQPESRKVSSYFNSQPQKDKPNEISLFGGNS